MEVFEEITMTQKRKALNFAIRFGGIGGDHHKAWVIDQMVRALTGCPIDSQGIQGESEEYIKLVQEAKAGDDGPETYAWEVGIPP
jgi:hypothetical protein